MIVEKENKLLEILRTYGPVVVAFSGGVDSSVLSKAAKLALGDKVVAITAASELLPQEELTDAKEVAEIIGIEHKVISVQDLANPKFVANDRERCYYCKEKRFALLTNWAQENGYQKVIEGSNLDDDGDYRPGMRALSENDFVASPLVAAGFNKTDIRNLAKKWNLPVWNKPSAACLASRISYGLEITADRLKQVERAERIVRQHVQGQLRVRHHGNLARIEVAAELLPTLLDHNVNESIVREIKKLGFTYVTLDLQGYRMGSQNEIL